MQFPSSASISCNTWSELDLFVDFDNNNITLWYDGSNQGTLPLTDVGYNAISSFTSFDSSGDASATCWSDVYTIRPYVTVSPQHSIWGGEDREK